MDRARGLLRAVGVVTCLAAQVAMPSTGWADADDEERVPSRVVVSFTDRDITESSGLVDAGDVLFTVNDSGGDAVVYGVRLADGRTVSRTTYSSSRPTDVEALALGLGRSLWVGDIGDNRRDRSSVEVYHLRMRDLPGPSGGGTATVAADVFSLVYPNGPQDAEALLVHPVTGRVYVATKSLTGGSVFAAVPRLRQGPANVMVEVGSVPTFVTDGAFFPDGEHILLRSYGNAAVFTFPALRQLASFRLPSQLQGEAVSISATGRVLLSTEGAYSDVRQIRLPADVARAALGSARGHGEPGPATAQEWDGGTADGDDDGPSGSASTDVDEDSGGGASPVDRSSRGAGPKPSLSTGDSTRTLWGAGGILVASALAWWGITFARGRRAMRAR